MDRWLTLTQSPEQSRTSYAKIGREHGFDDDRSLQFKDFTCLSRWLKRALKVIPEMERNADSIYPRGGYHREDFPLLWF